MTTRIGFALFLTAACSGAERNFYNLVADFHGARVYFQSRATRIDGFGGSDALYYWEKATGFHSIPRTDLLPGLYTVTENPQISSDASVVAYSRHRYGCYGGSSCMFFVPTVGSTLLFGNTEESYAGRVHLSRNGRFVYQSAHWGGLSPTHIDRITDRATRATVNVPGVSADPSRCIANDGTLLMTSNGNLTLFRNGELQSVNLPGREGSLLLDPTGHWILYQGAAFAIGRPLYAYSVRSKEGHQLAARAQSFAVSDAGVTAAWIGPLGLQTQVFLSEIARGSIPRQVTNEDSGVVSFALSGDGNVIFYVNGAGQLRRLEIASQTSTLLTNPPVVFSSNSNWFVPGSIFPIFTEIRPVRLTVAGRELPLLKQDETAFWFQAPWDFPIGAADEQLAVEIGPTSSFGRGWRPTATRSAPLFAVFPSPANPTAFHATGSPITRDSPLHPGEDFVLFATGLGPVDLAMRDGEPAPLDRLVRTRDNVDCRIEFWTGPQPTTAFAGLAPGLVGVYQINLKAPENLPQFGRPLVCNTGGRNSDQIYIPMLP